MESKQSIDLSQMVIIPKLQAYLEVQKGKHGNDSFDFNVDKGGLCFGLSVCYSVMNKIGKSAWWNSALTAIITWDGSEESLNLPLALPDSDSLDETLETLLEKVVNYLYFNHGKLTTKNMITSPNYRQERFLQPGGYFEYLDSEGHIHSIVQDEAVSGDFDDKELKQLLDSPQTKNAIKNNICLIIFVKHSMALQFHDDQWWFFDPNNESGEISFNENDYTGLINTINIARQKLSSGSIHSPSLTILIAADNQCDLTQFRSAYKKITDERMNILNDNTIHLISLHNPEIIEDFINNKKLDIHQTFRQKSLLLWARGNIGIVNALVQQGINLNSVDPNTGETALYFFAYQRDDPEILEVLLNNGANMHIKNKNGMTPLDIAIVKGHIESVRVLLNHKSALDCDSLTSNNDSPVHLAIKENNIEVLKLLIDRGFKFDSPDDPKNSPLYLALKLKKYAIARYLISEGASLENIKLNKFEATTSFKLFADITNRDEFVNIISKTDHKNRLALISAIPATKLKSCLLQHVSMQDAILSINQQYVDRDIKKALFLGLLQICKNDLESGTSTYQPDFFLTQSTDLDVGKSKFILAANALMSAIINNQSLDDIYSENTSCLNHGPIADIYSELKQLEQTLTCENSAKPSPF
ncbi:ankyrin repeat domain-containing protein [Legionella parisiensis]|uniref:Uncharacterized protein n=1 Tax=Legionella parisiensis TaxID=45071 RepID=A0A1E5JN85_9GAMM|nr:ankyrin repeat domain-containing protein [Legionella parisiensis]KTD42871.1 Ankyrin repeats (3 copies) [Legionella parisiensis]OEH45996.1 hypothetical protein lpari_03048 [Legionella parisiensis]STX78055.1 Ribulose-5-phosphate 4-epimerase and related epimerases and aldolases [Legionella parisiensis]